MRISSTFIRLALLSVVLIFSVLALANGPGRTRSQEVTTATLDALPATSDTLVVPASDSPALARVLSAAGFRAPGQPLHLYLEGGTYTFADPGSAEAPSLPPILNTVVIHGNEAVIRLYDEGGASDSLAVTATGDLTLKHVTLLSGSARAIVNDGRLRLEDSRVANDQGAPDYYLPDGGGIENRGVLEVTRTVFERNRLLSRSAPGGAIWNAGQLAVTCARFVDNVASAGGAVYNTAEGTARIAQSLFDGNRANGGGAIFNAAAAPVEAGGNWWHGGTPAVNSLYAGVNTVSDGVTFAPVADADPTQTDPACAALLPEPLPALPRLAAQATRTPTPVATATPSPVGRGLMAHRYIPLPDDEWISFPEFTLSSLDYLSLVDSAVHTQEDAIQLMQGETPTTLYAGALWSPSKQTLSGGFHTAFRFRVTRLVDSGGDGFAFVIQNTGTGAVGIGGCSNGYNGISSVFAVEFDLYWNNYFCAETQDPSDNHLGVMTGNHLHTNPALVYAVPKPTLNFKDGQVHSVVIDYELDPPRLEINLDDGLVTWTANINPAWLPLDGQNKAWVGLVAGQFGARANVDILDWTFTHSQQNPTPTPTPTLTPTPIPTVIPGGCAITTTTDVAFRESPTFNSPRLNTVPQNTSLTATYRLQTTLGSIPDVWYQVTYNGQEAWIGARVSAVPNVDNVDCDLPAPYPPEWVSLAQIEQGEVLHNGVCDVDGYFLAEEPALVMARVAYAEGAIYQQSQQGGDYTGGVVYADAFRIAWIIRMDALMGLPNYRTLGVAGRSVSINQMALTQGAYAPITGLRSELASNGCQPQSISEIDYPNVLRMVYPQNSGAKAELYQLYRIYQTVRISILDAAWSDMYSDIQGLEQFKGVLVEAACPSGADGLLRPGPAFPWATNQPYPPQPVYAYLDPQPNQSHKTCYQDVYHLDDLFLAALAAPQPDLSQLPVGYNENTFPLPAGQPNGYCVKLLQDPNATPPAGQYYLAQLTGKNGMPWPEGLCP